MIDIRTYKLGFGKHKGKKISEVPASYLVSCLELGRLRGDLQAYVAENIEYFQQEAYKENPLTDDSIMPFGKHKGKKMEDVPAGYLLKLNETLPPGNVKNYIKENMDVLNHQLRNKW